jgi:hypothetical protein
MNKDGTTEHIASPGGEAIVPVQVVYRPEDLDAIYERRLKFVDEAHGKATAYDTAITIAGYGAFFALWSGVAGDVSPTARTATAALIGVSLLFYIGWTMLAMLTRHRYDKEFVEAIQKSQSPDEAIAEWDMVDLKKRLAQLSLLRWWRFIYGTAVLTGVSGALLLVYNAVAVATGLPPFPD